jgi:hypothetical protein
MAAMSIATEVEKLVKLREEGKLTEEQFQQAHAALVASNVPMSEGGVLRKGAAPTETPKSVGKKLWEVLDTLFTIAFLGGMAWWLFGTDSGRGLLSKGADLIRATGLVESQDQKYRRLIVGTWYSGEGDATMKLTFTSDGRFMGEGQLAVFGVIIQGLVNLVGGNEMVGNYNINNGNLTINVNKTEGGFLLSGRPAQTIGPLPIFDLDHSSFRFGERTFKKISR